MKNSLRRGSFHLPEFLIIGQVGCILLWIVGLLGWVLNIVQVLSHIPAQLNEATPMYILRIVGILAVPLGSVLGFFPS
jgi:hypothetical protein